MSLLTACRPRSFDEVVGHDAVVASLRSAVRKRSSHSFLFTGDSGLGKTTLARLTARALGATSPTEIDAATYTGIDDMREITASMASRPLLDGVWATIIDEAQGLSKAAWTSLLKATEEPPPWAFWFFCTTEPGKVPKTMRTRCLTYDLKPVSRGVLLGLANRVVAEAKLPLSLELVRLCVERAAGSPRQLLANMAVVEGVGDKAAAQQLLEAAEENPAAVELARVLLREHTWTGVRDVLGRLPESTSPETVRRVVVAYFTKVALDEREPKLAMEHCHLLDCFAEPISDMAGLLLACSRALWSKPRI